MQDKFTVTGIVIKQMPVGESDRVITILTTNKGKLTAFARGARKQNSRFGATTCPYCFGVFTLYPGKDSYTVSDTDIKNYFEEFFTDFDAACYAAYFGEICDYYCRENNDEMDMLKLLYQSLRALISSSFDNRLVRAAFELKAICIQGEYPGIPEDVKLSESAGYTLDFINRTPAEKLFSFSLKESVLIEVIGVANRYRKKLINHKFKSLEILEGII